MNTTSGEHMDSFVSHYANKKKRVIANLRWIVTLLLQTIDNVAVQCFVFYVPTAQFLCHDAMLNI